MTQSTKKRQTFSRAENEALAQKILEKKNQGFMAREIAAKLGVTEAKVLKVFRRAGARLTPEQRSVNASRRRGVSSAATVQEALALRAKGLTNAQISETMSLPLSTVISIVRKAPALSRNEVSERHRTYRPEALLAVVDATKRGETAQEIAAHQALTPGAVRYLRGRAGIAGEARQAQMKALAEARELLALEVISVRTSDPSASNSEVAAALGLGSDAFKAIVRAHGLYLTPEQLRARALSPEKTQTAVAQRLLGMKMAEIAKALSVEESVLRRLFFRHRILLTPESRSRNVSRPSKYSWGAVRQVAHASGMEVMDGAEDESLISGFTTVGLRCRCGHVWTAGIYDTLYGKVSSCGCVRSGPQLAVTDLVRSWGFTVKVDDASVIGPRQLDIYVPDKKMAIEYNGLKWHGQLLKEDRYGIGRGEDEAKTYHLAKLEDAARAGVRLITVFSDEWLERREQVVGYLRAILGQDLIRVGARELEVVEGPSTDETRDFFETHHIQGPGGGPVSVVLREEGGAVRALAAFRQRGERVWELTRFCVQIGYAVPGALSRVLALFGKNHGRCQVISFADRRWSTGGVYARAGFTLDRVLPPSYWYARKDRDTGRMHKSGFRKEKIAARLGPLLPGETEWEAMKRFGFDRIWDCGLMRWVIELGQ